MIRSSLLAITLSLIAVHATAKMASASRLPAPMATSLTGDTSTTTLAFWYNSNEAADERSDTSVDRRSKSAVPTAVRASLSLPYPPHTRAA